MARKILLADDSVTAQNMGRKILADAGYDVITVNNGSAALKRISEIKPDLIVLDVYMPGYSGLEVCQRIKDAEDTAHIPVLLTVGKLEPFKPEEARRVRADAHIVKPFEASELLTAITKLEDRMVPQQAEASRYSSSSAGVERFSGETGGRKSESKGEIDIGWKNRIRFPSKKKKEDAEPDPEDLASAAGATFRDFRKGKGKGDGKNGANAAFAVNGPLAGQESAAVPDIPRDITPEELDALSAVAEKLDASPSADTSSLAEKNQPKEAAADSAPAIVESAPEKIESSAIVAESPKNDKDSDREKEKEKEREKEKEKGEQSAVESAPSAAVEAAVPAPQAAATVSSVAENPAGQEPAAADASPIVSDPVIKFNRRQTDRQELPSLENIVSPVQSPSSADGPAEPAEAAAQSQDQDKDSGTKAKTKSDEVAAALPIAAKTPSMDGAEAPPPEAPPPNDADLAEALRLLTPSAANPDTVPSNTSTASNEKPPEHSQLLSEETMRSSALGPRWVAETVALSAGEAALSLEAEMFRTFSAGSGTGSADTPATLSAVDPEADHTIGFSGIAAAVETRLAEAGLAVHSKASANEHEHSAENAASAAAAALEASAELLAAASAATPVVDQIGADVERRITADRRTAERYESQALAQAESAQDVTAQVGDSATFADAVDKDNDRDDKDAADSTASSSELQGNQVQVSSNVPNNEDTASPTTAVTAENQDSEIEVGGQNSMGKETTTKSGKSNWREIRTAPANTAETDIVEAAKQATPAAENPQKAMAAAAAENSADPGTIASIVDSVMADLRPRIVEEIAKKLAGK